MLPELTRFALRTSQESNERIKNDKLESVLSYIKIRRFPRGLSRRLRRHFRELYDTKVA